MSRPVHESIALLAELGWEHSQQKALSGRIVEIFEKTVEIAEGTYTVGSYTCEIDGNLMLFAHLRRERVEGVFKQEPLANTIVEQSGDLVADLGKACERLEALANGASKALSEITSGVWPS